MKTANMNFGEAVRTLAADAGLPIYKFTKLDEEREKKWQTYSKILEKYKSYYHNELKNNKSKELESYLLQRGLTEKEINYFKIGFVPKEASFFEKLKNDFSESDILNSGLFYFDEKNKKYIERFRDRLIFPINGLTGSTIAFGGRIISNQKLAKYINSPETLFFKKGNSLFNLDKSRHSSTNHDEVFLVEGYMDVVNLHKFGIRNVVANLGTAMTEKQIDLIWGFFKNPIICLDGDSSGQKAALRAAERLFPLMKPDFNIYFITLPENLDPDAYINQKGKESFLKFTKSKMEIQNFIWDSYFQDVDRNNPHSLSLFEKKIKSLCNDVKDKTLSKYFLDNFIQRINELTPNLNYKKNQFFKFNKRINPLQKTKEVYKQRNKFLEKELKEFSILFLIINNLDIFRSNIELISEVTFSNNLMTEFKQKLIDYLLSEKFFDRKKLKLEDFDVKFKDIINLININAPVKIITKNKNEKEIIMMFTEIISEIKKIDLQKKIESLENKVSLNLDEKLYSELLSLRNQLKGG